MQKNKETMDSNLDAIGAEEPDPSADTSGSDTGEDATGGEDDGMDGFDFNDTPEEEPAAEEPAEEEPVEEPVEEEPVEEPKEEKKEPEADKETK